MNEILYMIGILLGIVLIIATAYYLMHVRDRRSKQHKNSANSKYRYRRIDNYKNRVHRRKSGYLRDRDFSAILN